MGLVFNRSLWKHFRKKPFEKEAEEAKTKQMPKEDLSTDIGRKANVIDFFNMSAINVHMEIKTLYMKNDIEGARNYLEAALEKGFSGKRLDKWKEILLKE